MPRWLPCIILVACAWMLWEQVVSLLQGAQMPREGVKCPATYETKAACEQQAVRASTSQAEFWARAPKATRVNRLTPTGIEIFFSGLQESHSWICYPDTFDPRRPK